MDDQFSNHPSFATIDLSSISHNLRVIKEKVGHSVKVLAVVKSDGYGHGLVPVAQRLSSDFGAKQDERADAFGVSFVHEGVTLRKAGILEPILVLGGAAKDEERWILDYSLIPLVSSLKAVKILEEVAAKSGRQAKVHMKVDTGMSRLGMPESEVLPALEELSNSKWVEVEGLCTHLAFAFLENREKNLEQLNRFDNLVNSVKKAGYSIPLIHVCNSAGIFAYPEAHYNMVRGGIALYGSSPFEYPFPGLDLKPAMSWETQILHIRELAKGASVSYGGHFTANKESKLATLPIGYSHGLYRNLSGKIHALVRGKRAPQVGTICMDFTSIDVTEIADCRVGERVVLLGANGKEGVSAEEWAEKMGTIPYEIYCHIGRLTRKKYAE